MVEHKQAPVQGVTAAAGTSKARFERAAIQLFAERGADAVSIKEIAARAGLSQGAIYRYYASKDDLARDLFEEIHKRLYTLVEKIANAGLNFNESVTELIKGYCQQADQDRDLFDYYLAHVNRFVATPHRDRPDIVSVMAARLRQAMQAGDIPAGDPEVKAAVAMGCVMQPAIHRRLGRFNHNLTDHADTLARAALAALSAP